MLVHVDYKTDIENCNFLINGIPFEKGFVRNHHDYHFQ